MKFADGFWLNKRGYEVNYASQAYEIQTGKNSINVLATTNYKAYLSKVVNDIEGNDITNKIDKEFTYLVLKTGVYYYNYKYSN